MEAGHPARVLRIWSAVVKEWNMKNLLSLIAVPVASLFLASLAWAQPGPGMGGMGGMGPGAGMGPGNGPCANAQAGNGPMCNWRTTRQNSPGFGLMTPQERLAHRDRMRSLQSREECVAYLTEHHAQMAERAKAKGQTLPGPRMMMCDRLPAAK